MHPLHLALSIYFSHQSNWRINSFTSNIVDL
jgi:hypothetical protein